MKVNTVEKECMARVGLAIEFSNSECSSIERVANVLNNAVDKAVDQAKQIVEHGKETKPRGDIRYSACSKVPVLIDLETATRISWLLGNLVHNSSSSLFADADKMALITLSDINGEKNELSERE